MTLRHSVDDDNFTCITFEQQLKDWAEAATIVMDVAGDVAARLTRPLRRREGSSRTTAASRDTDALGASGFTTRRSQRP